MSFLVSLLWIALVFAPFIGFFGAIMAWGWARETGRYTFSGAAAFGLAAFLGSVGLYLSATPAQGMLVHALGIGDWARPWLGVVVLIGGAACLLAVAAVWRPVIRRVLFVASLPGALVATVLGGVIVFTYRSEMGLLVLAPAVFALAHFAFMAVVNPRLRLLPNGA